MRCGFVSFFIGLVGLPLGAKGFNQKKNLNPNNIIERNKLYINCHCKVSAKQEVYCLKEPTGFFN